MVWREVRCFAVVGDWDWIWEVRRVGTEALRFGSSVGEG